MYKKLMIVFENRPFLSLFPWQFDDRQKNNLSGDKKTNEAISETDGVYNNLYLTRANRRALSMEREKGTSCFRNINLRLLLAVNIPEIAQNRSLQRNAAKLLSVQHSAWGITLFMKFLIFSPVSLHVKIDHMI